MASQMFFITIFIGREEVVFTLALQKRRSTYPIKVISPFAIIEKASGDLTVACATTMFDKEKINSVRLDATTKKKVELSKKQASLKLK